MSILLPCDVCFSAWKHGEDGMDRLYGVAKISKSPLCLSYHFYNSEDFDLFTFSCDHVDDLCCVWTNSCVQTNRLIYTFTPLLRHILSDRRVIDGRICGYQKRNLLDLCARMKSLIQKMIQFWLKKLSISVRVRDTLYPGRDKLTIQLHP